MEPEVRKAGASSMAVEVREVGAGVEQGGRSREQVEVDSVAIIISINSTRRRAIS
jgi:hypothetical protein